jgi:predicted AAA+ superfamily ATPase
MNFKKTTAYALRILDFLLHNEKERFSAADLHSRLQIPRQYLRQLLTNLTKNLAFFINLAMSVGLRGVLGIFAPSKLETTKLLPADQPAV